MITDASQIKEALCRYSSTDGKPMGNFFYRLEWYRIGISVSMEVYSSEMPAFQLRPECQLTKTEILPELPDDLEEINFKIFVIPYKNAVKNEDLELDTLNSWLQKKLKGAATIINSEFGANNRIYYKAKPDATNLKQIQSYSLKGKLKCLDVNKLESIRQKPLGYYDDLGCGLLLLE